MNRIIALTLFFSLFSKPVCAEMELLDIYIGMPKDKINVALLPCENDLCGEVYFGDKPWKGRYIMQNEMLTGITISSQTDEEAIQAVFKGINESPNMLMYAETDDGFYNFIAQSLDKNPEKLQEDYLKWLETTSKDSEYMLYLYVEPEFYAHLQEREVTDKTLQTKESNLKYDSGILAIADDPAFSDTVITLISMNNKEVIVLSSTIKMIHQRLEEIHKAENEKSEKSSDEKLKNKNDNEGQDLESKPSDEVDAELKDIEKSSVEKNEKLDDENSIDNKSDKNKSDEPEKKPENK